jgi:hypothetical protein
VALYLINWYSFLILDLSTVMEQLNAMSLLPVGPIFLERVRALPMLIREVVMHGFRHRFASALAATHLHSDADLRVVEPGFLLELPVQRAS